MRVVGKFLSLISGRRPSPLTGEAHEPQAKSAYKENSESAPETSPKTTGSLSGTGFQTLIATDMHRPARNISSDLASEVEVKMLRYRYVFHPCTKPQDDFVPWFKRSSNTSRAIRRKDGHAWLRPFMSAEVAQHASLQLAVERGAKSAKSVPTVLRAIIREKRKNKEPHDEFLKALYGACVLVDFVESLQDEYQTFFYDMSDFVDFDDLVKMRCDFRHMGYRRVKALKPTDIRWLSNRFGEPSFHLSYEPLWGSLRRDAVRRYCRAEVLRGDSTLTDSGVEANLQRWLQGRLEFSVRIRNEDQARASATAARLGQRTVGLGAFKDVWDSTRSEFVVADLETTGLDPKSCEILELAAVKADSEGTVISQYSALVRISRPLPDAIAELTKISQGQIDEEGLPLYNALHAFLAFVGERPVFFHNAPFDIAFLQRAAEQVGLRLFNVVHDTLPIARAAWPEMRSHKLETLAKIIEAAPSPSHRALADAKSALAVLMAARAIAQRDDAQ